MTKSSILRSYFSETTLCHLKPQQGLSERYLRRAIDVSLAAKLTLTYGKYHLSMLHRQLAMSEEQTTYQQGRADGKRTPIFPKLHKNSGKSKKNDVFYMLIQKKCVTLP